MLPGRRKNFPALEPRVVWPGASHRSPEPVHLFTPLGPDLRRRRVGVTKSVQAPTLENEAHPTRHRATGIPCPSPDRPARCSKTGLSSQIPQVNDSVYSRHSINGDPLFHSLTAFAKAVPAHIVKNRAMGYRGTAIAAVSSLNAICINIACAIFSFYFTYFLKYLCSDLVP